MDRGIPRTIMNYGVIFKCEIDLSTEEVFNQILLNQRKTEL